MHLPSILLSFSAMICLSACGAKKEVTSPDPGTLEDSAWPATLTTDQGGYDVTLKPGTESIERNKHFTLDVKLRARKGSLDNIKLKVDADMPAHRHGMNTQPVVSKKEAADYQVDGMLFHMGGDWVITVDVENAGKTERATFPVSVE